MSLSLKPSVLEQYAADMKVARALRSTCVHCAVREVGDSYCARHSLRCALCGTSEVAHREPFPFPDGVAAWICAECDVQSSLDFLDSLPEVYDPAAEIEMEERRVESVRLGAEYLEAFR